MELPVTVTIDRSFNFTADLLAEPGCTIFGLKEKLAALDPTGNTQASSFALGKSPQAEWEAVQPLPDDLVVSQELAALDVCPVPEPAPEQAPAPPVAASTAPAQPAAPLSGADAAREAARQAARQAQAARREREAAAAQAKAEAEARKKAEAEAARERMWAQAQAAGPAAHPWPQPSPGPAQAAPVPQPSVPTLAGVPIAEDDGETRVKGVSADGRYVFAYVGGLQHPHDVLALIDLFKGEASIEDLQRNKARFVYAGGTQDKASSVQVQREVIIEATGLEKGDYELASFAHDNMTKQLNKHLTKDNCVVMFGGKCLKIVAQHGV